MLEPAAGSRASCFLSTVFLEVNPVGEYFWLEDRLGFPISERIADVLLARGARR